MIKRICSSPGSLPCALAALSIVVFSAVAAQTPNSVAPGTLSSAGAADVIAEPAQPSFSARTNLVVLRVVVRDKQGAVIPNLKKEDFQLFDKGKVQVISSFAAESPGSSSKKVSEEKGANPLEPAAPTGPAAPIPERYIAYLFDDVHLQFGDLAQARTAADGQIALLRPTDRAGIFSTSGQTALEFTDDLPRLRDTLLRLQPRPIARSSSNDCPDIGYYQADQIVNKNDQQALDAAVMEYSACYPQNPPPPPTVLQQYCRSAAQIVLSAGDQETRVSLIVLKDLVRRMATLPGERRILLISPGFLAQNARFEETEVIDRSIHSDVVINSLDARGLYTVDLLGDISKRVIDSNAQRIKGQYETQAASLQTDFLGEIAQGTGGTLFAHNNDLKTGFTRLAAAPESYYVLGFSPANLKYDGSYHSLKVTLKEQKGVTLQARKGYYAPKKATDPLEAAKQDIQEALFSIDQMRGLPVDMHTQFFKLNDIDAKLSVLTHVDLRQMRFKKEGGRNFNNLTLVTGLFDRNGNYIKGLSKTLEMRLRDETLQSRLTSGITVKSDLDVKPGSYRVRLVVRDSEGQTISAENATIEIP